VTCAGCGFDNPEGMKFCGECGEALRVAAHCPGCGFESPPGFKFCGECGASLSAREAAPRERAPRDYTPKHLADEILRSKSALEGERKQVTVLFADVKGSTELAEELDPEDWHAILERFFEILSAGVHRFGGTVNQYTGDGIMALFGAPLAHEDHAQRACFAALWLRDALRAYTDELRIECGLGFSVRTGLHSGEVVVGKIGDDLRMDYTAQGHTVNLAARMQQIAEPGHAYLTADTARLVEGYFALRDLGATAVKGVSEPVGVRDLEGMGALRTRLAVSRARGFSKFVGRSDETALLDSALERSLSGGGLTVGVVAEAGTGKSRLCFEFLERCRARGLTIFETRAVAHGRQIPLLPMLELMRDFFSIEERDSDRVAREKIAGRLLLLDERLADDVPLFFDLLGVPDPDRPAPALDPDEAQRRLFAAMRGIVLADGAIDPGVVVVEDLHWIDPASDALLAHILEANAATRGLVLLNFRPDYEAGWMRQSWYQQLPLAPLGAEAIRELLESLLGSDSSVAGLADLVEARSAGNPFFIEEIVQELAEAGALEGAKGCYRLTRPIESLAVPATVQAVLAARIDRLAEREKHVLQTAAAIGKTFPERLLRRVAELPDRDLDDALRTLRSAEFLYEESVYPDVEYAFKHPLTQEVAQGSQLRERRRETHAALARAIEELDADKLDERAALIAHHFEQAGELLPSARWHARAAEWIGHSNYHESFAHWRRVQALVADDASDEARELLARACPELLAMSFRLGIPEQEAEAIFEQGRSLLERRGDLTALAKLELAYSLVFENVGAARQYLEHARTAFELADRVEDRVLDAPVGVELAHALWLTGGLDESVTASQQVLDITGDDIHFGTDILGYSPAIMERLLPVWPLSEAGRLDEAAALLADGLSLARRHGSPEMLCWAHGLHAVLAIARGDSGAATRGAQLAAEAAERSGSQQNRLCSEMWGAVAALSAGDPEGALAGARSALVEAREKRVYLECEPTMLETMARAQLALGEGDSALELAEEMRALTHASGMRLFESQALLLHAEVLRRSQGAAAADLIESDLSQARALIDATGAKLRLAQHHRERGLLAGLRGDAAARQQALGESHRLATELGAWPWALEAAEDLRRGT
jgi:class 3 adenylate cyclase